MARGIYKGFYDCKRTLNETDANGNLPRMVFIVSKGRSLGKTFSVCRYIWNNYVLKGRKFALLTRNRTALGHLAQGVFGGMLEQDLPRTVLIEKTVQQGVATEIFARTLEEDGEFIEESVGYVLSIKAAGDIKTISSTFVSVDVLMFDEFQTVPGTPYLPSEFALFENLYVSVARGGGKRQRFVRVFMLSNAINIFNPYFIKLKMTQHIQSSTRFYRGNGFIYERCVVDGAAQQDITEGIQSMYIDEDDPFMDDNSWLGDDGSCVCKPNKWGRAIYWATIRNGSETYALRGYPEVGYLYLDRKVDKDCKTVFNARMGENLNLPLLKKAKVFTMIRDNFTNGTMRFSDDGIKRFALELFV